MSEKRETYHKTVAIFNENITGAPVSFEEFLQIALPHSIRQTADINSGSNHFLDLFSLSKIEKIPENVSEEKQRKSSKQNGVLE